MYEEIRSRLAARPFEPFHVVTADGWHGDVTDPRLCELNDEVVRFYRSAPQYPGRAITATVAIRHIVRVTNDDDRVPY